MTAIHRDETAAPSAEIRLPHEEREVQRFGALRLLPIALAAEARQKSCQLLNGILADTMILYAMYKKHHWLVAGRRSISSICSSTSTRTSSSS
jgi:starvation-inducible DNA-binding protein